MGSDYRLGSVTKLLQQMQLFLIQALPRCVATVAAARARLVTDQHSVRAEAVPVGYLAVMPTACVFMR
jgi:hypothetical protein